MPQIKILPVDVRNKIAAGEVVERPASVVKELIENAIDAGSTEIRVEVLRGGKGLIRVTDNGVGMDREDALLSIEPHATSKLRDDDDLFHITTMGFRGEALPSIAAVSRMKLVTGQKNASSGLAIEIQAGKVMETRDAPSIGTTLEVRDLFFNTPARKKFLKSDNTELFHIIDTVTREGLSHWEIGFRLITANQETMVLPRASGRGERILQIYGREFMEGLSTVEAEGDGIKMAVFFSRPDNFRNSKSHQFIFLNRRPVKDQTISHAVYKAFEGILPRDRHPVFFLYIDIDPAKVDCNVHPTKREVRFQNKDEIYRLVSGSLRDAVRKERMEYVEPFTRAPVWTDGETPLSSDINDGVVPPSLQYGRAPSSDRQVSENVEFLYEPSLPFMYLGDTFIAMAGKGGLTLIDHHAAHERILYERLSRGVNLDSHQLLFPSQIRLSHKEYSVILQNKGLLAEMGMEIDDFGHDTVIVRALPDALKGGDLRGILSDAAAAMIEGTQPDSSLKEGIAARIACHASVRGKEILSQEGFRRLLSDLEKTDKPDQCPHGRPTRIFFSLDDMKKMFKRK
ncbi:MAG TPA: DNA mismatch repair endonuclease MutL [Thermodesulfovibrionales bacterium]|nr:DNA mismatch repair endonuclease MutL [Thermodesulfovibrionales bacterium]